MSGSGSGSVLEQVVPSSSVSAITIQETENTETKPSGTTPTLLLKLTKPPKSDKKVDFQAGTVDNEHMNKKKSKCCCIYQKPTVFGESSSDSEDDCDHCSGHSGKKKKKNLNSSQDNQNGPEPADPVPV